MSLNQSHLLPEGEAEALRALALRYSVSQQDAAERMNMHYSRVSRIMSRLASAPPGFTQRYRDAVLNVAAERGAAARQELARV